MIERRKISLNVSGSALRYLDEEIAKGRDVTDIITEALRCMAEETPRERVLRQEIERLHTTLGQINQGASKAVSALGVADDSWKW